MELTHPPFILGIHYFCDHRCWRCPLSGRCAVFARWVDSRSRGPQPTEPAGRVAVALALSLEVTMEEATLMMQAAPRMVTPPAQGSNARTDRRTVDPEAAARRAEHDPLVGRGAEYAKLTWPVLRAVRPILVKRGDLVAADAAERLEEMCATLASKIFRAVSSAAEDDEDDDVQTDANGSAKVALLLIEESRQAWQALMQPGLAAADGAPPRFVALLDGLEVELHRRFPRAFEFVRPGFDTGDAPGTTADAARALLLARANSELQSSN